MKMMFRWFGEGNDTVPLRYIKQIPGTEGIVWALHDLPAGEEWPMEKIEAVRKQAVDSGLSNEVVESVNVHEAIKLGHSDRDYYIENYKKTIEKLASVGVKVICYNFMPVFDWFRTDLKKRLKDGSTALFYEHEKVTNMNVRQIVKQNADDLDFHMPGWEPERLGELSTLLDSYQGITEEDLFSNLHYFLNAIIPTAEANGVKMAIHPDDPPWSIFGLPRIITNRENISRMLKMVDSASNCLTFCSGSLGANPKNHPGKIVREFADRIAFAHIRNVKTEDNGDFIEASHRTQDGSIDIYDVVKALHESGYKGYVRPDHGRHIWDEVCRPGYGLYDRALGIMYLLGVWDSLNRIPSLKEK
ncbi:mannonate dehydratase [Alkalihalobacillus hwajinpoensis]|uniref:mannonate dehydratase n=1 Tax=Guptibacillus hwajinpoensis TaxID=208199 RepID=UPI0018840ABD|nr:mannonate dehydratase [Pseudalkalibacillus hwajinpoensis]MBF0709344.1 mannonate dehydratase [Pseudalkalibacillus hwajinpoensis]